MSRGRLLRWLLPLLAVAGLAYALVYTTVLAKRPVPRPEPLALPAESRYPSTISASGLIEASSRNVTVGSFVSGVVTRVPVVEGDRVRRGDLLFALDSRVAEADLLTAQRDLAAARARLAEAETELADREDQLQRVRRLRTGEVVSEDRVFRLRFAADGARAQVATARALAEVAEARVRAAQVTLDRLHVEAPIDGRVLRVNVRPGAFVVAGETADPPVLLGQDQPLHVRAQIDETDIWRLKPGAVAEAVVRGNRDLRFPLTFVRIDPYVVPKRSLTGDTTERVDTRVLEVIFRFDPGALPVYIGQQVDVFIDAVGQTPPRTPAPPPAGS